MLWARGTLKLRVAAVRGIHAEIIRGGALRLWVGVALSSRVKGAERVAFGGEDRQDVLPSLLVPR